MKTKHKKLGEKKIRIKDSISGYDKRVIIKTFRLPNGVIENFFIDCNNDSVQIFPITHNGLVVTVMQFRPGFEKDNVELPGGGIEKKENPYSAANRELKEETGYSGKVKYLGTVPYGPYSTGKRHMFLATDCKKVDSLNLDENEFLNVVLWPLDRFKNMIKGSCIYGFDCAYIGLNHLGML